MPRMIREFAEIRDYTSIDRLIDQLTALRDAVPCPAEAQLRLRGDDIFGRSLTISYLRPQTDEEVERDARYGDAYLESLLRTLAAIEREMGEERLGSSQTRLAA